MAETRFIAACVQTTSGNEIAPNIAAASALVREARGQGAQFIALPEVVSLMDTRARIMFERSHGEADDPALKAFCGLADELDIHLLAGSLAIRLAPDKIANRSYLIGPSGEVLARYDKIHMFDVDLPGGESYRESQVYQPGDAARVVDLPWGRLGMTICYDLRFPALYQALARAGASFITVPAAFTKVTGQAHWHVLLRARAIETGCFIIAPGQWGTHANGRQTYGHSLIVNPWGEVLADAGEGVGVISAEINPGEVSAARQRIPNLRSQRAFSAP